MLNTNDILDSFKMINPKIIQKTIDKYTTIYKNKYPQIDFSKQENIDFIVMPVVAAELTIELNKNKLLSTNTINGVIDSNMTEDEKLSALKAYAKLIGFKPISNSWENLYNEIIQFTQNNWYNLKTPISNFILNKFNYIENIYISDSNSSEMVRNRVYYIQIPGMKINTFELSDNNQTNLFNYAFSIDDYEKYKAAKEGGFFSLPSCIDLYLFTEIKESTLKVTPIDNYFSLKEGYYVSVECDEHQIIHSNFNDKNVDGIIFCKPRFYVDTEEEIEIKIREYILPNKDEIKVDELVTTSDILIKAPYPIFISLLCYSSEKYSSSDKENMKNILNEYLKSKHRNPKEISLKDMSNVLLSNNYNVDLQPKVNIELYPYINYQVKKEAIFPLTKKDYRLNNADLYNQISNNTSVFYIKDINVIPE